MPRVYQLSELLIRGTIASQTMKRRLAELSKTERIQFEDLYERVLNDPELKSAQGRLVRDLRNTIGCEYAESPAAAKQEFRFVVWKSLVYAIYHCDYSFKCKHCSAGKYRAKSGRMTPINKEMAICPACNHVEHNGAFYPFPTVAHLPTKSPIEAVKGTPKLTIAEMNELLGDSKAMAKWVRKFTASYVHQILRENKIKYEGKHTEETDFADIACKRELQGLLETYNIKYTTVTSSSVIHTEQSLELAPIKFTAEYCALKARYSEFEVIIEDSDQVPTTKLHIKAPAITKRITTTVTSYQPVLILNQPGNGSIDDDTGQSDNSYVIEHRKYSLDGKRRISSDLPSMRTETSEMLEVMRRHLGDGDPIWVFDCITQGVYVPEDDRPAWEAFAAQHEDDLNEIMRNDGTQINNKKLASLLGISTRVVQEVIAQMRVLGTTCGYDYRQSPVNYD